MKKFFRKMAEGVREAEMLGLSERHNWTPLLHYIHATRLILGVIIGVLFGFLVGLQF